ncbi:TetR/AcrR family transcriptional regulator [Halobacillus salinarum]|uniref:TetR/AcrR family transcriptional regulator n=1 Tax=Halobacillus salinarum TaxID=2932257 RepID=A0ABY4EQG3_9BACI|nr:TetR/AcrR family transcriptional regulator [Halobacillus salinarum]UOQ45884.1 TetR/AcrR family transcriptional regulator [Halobacillus salinarum]
MAGLREEKKKQTQLAIMESAKKIFSEKGFENASMVEIAKDAAVGTGTIYNYFSSKGALLLQIFSEETSRMEMKEPQRLKASSEAGLAERISEFILQFTVLFSHYPKAFWKELFHVMTEEAQESIHLRQGLFGLDEDIMKDVTSIISTASEQFLLPVDPEDAAYVIYSSVMTDTLFYIYSEDMSYETYAGRISEHIKFVLAGKIKGRQPGSI